MLYFAVYHCSSKLQSMIVTLRFRRIRLAAVRPLRIRLTAIIVACLFFAGNALPVYADPDHEERVELQRAMPIQSNEIENWPIGPVVNAESAILIEAETGIILYAKNIHQKSYPASTTKILTALIAAERCSLDDVISFSHSAVFDTPRNSSHLAIDPGEELTMDQALHALLIASANEVAFAIGEHIAGTWQDFGDIMNSRATELGAQNSNFINPNGLPDDDHYTTAYDLAMIGRAFFDNEFLSKIASTPLLDIPPSDKQPDILIAHSRNQLLPGKAHEYMGLVGSKTGYTNAARNCLVSSAERDGMKLICVVFKNESPQQFEDTVALFDYGFGNFEKIAVAQAETKYSIDNAGSFYSERDIFGSSKPILSLNRDDSIILPKNIQLKDTTSSISYDTAEEGQVAVITYSYSGVILGTASVDLAGREEVSYTFDTPLQSVEIEEEEEVVKEPSFIFVNAVIVLLVLAGIVVALFLFLIIRGILKNYKFSAHKVEEKERRIGRRIRRRKRTGLQFATRSPLQPRGIMQVRDTGWKSYLPWKQSSSKKRKGKRPSRFRDYDF